MNLKKRQAVVLVAASALTFSAAAVGVSFAATGGSVYIAEWGERQLDMPAKLL